MISNYLAFKHVLRTKQFNKRRWQSQFVVQYSYTIDFGSFTWPLFSSIYSKLHDLGNNWRGKAIMYRMKSVLIIHKYGRDINDDDVSNQTRELEDDLPFICSISKEHSKINEIVFYTIAFWASLFSTYQRNTFYLKENIVVTQIEEKLIC